VEKGLQENLRSALGGFVRETRTETPDRNSEYKIWIIARKDVVMSTGKFGPQAAHAAGTCMVLTALDDREKCFGYMAVAQPKITVGVENGEELVKAVEACRAAGLVAVLVEDAGHTELEGKTLTVGAVGPCLRSELPGWVRRLRRFEAVPG